MTNASITATQTLLTTPPARDGFETPAGNSVLERKTFIALATSLRNTGYEDLMLVSNGDSGIEVIAARPISADKTFDQALYNRQRLRDENDPQNGRSVLIAVSLTQSLDEQEWDPQVSEIQIATLSEAPLISKTFKPLNGELIPDTPADSVERHTLPEVLTSWRSQQQFDTMGLPVEKMMVQKPA